MALVLIVEIAKRRAAFETKDVQSVVELESVRPVPHAPQFVLGLSALRSNTLTVIDAAAAMGLPRREGLEADARAVIVDHAGHRYALVVDAIDDVAEQLTEPAPVPGEAGAHWAHASEGLVETDRGPAMLMSIDRLLGGPAALAA